MLVGRPGDAQAQQQHRVEDRAYQHEGGERDQEQDYVNWLLEIHLEDGLVAGPVVVEEEGAELGGPAPQGLPRAPEPHHVRVADLLEGPVVQDQHQLALRGALQRLAAVRQARARRRGPLRLGDVLGKVLQRQRYVAQARVSAKERRLAHHLDLQRILERDDREMHQAVESRPEVAPSCPTPTRLLPQDRPDVRVGTDPMHGGEVPRLDDEDLQHAAGNGRHIALRVVGCLARVVGRTSVGLVNLKNHIHPEDPDHRANQVPQRAWHRGVVRVPVHHLIPELIEQAPAGALR
mmetsp:Transcript_53972/g.139007  ORF Transcript_53972/g.139007 Transcript_53972/m.139007 type:complete len:292 (+) Transcript_53972:1833-2708(+)